MQARQHSQFGLVSTATFHLRKTLSKVTPAKSPLWPEASCAPGGFEADTAGQALPGPGQELGCVWEKDFPLLVPSQRFTLCLAQLSGGGSFLHHWYKAQIPEEPNNLWVSGRFWLSKLIFKA